MVRATEERFVYCKQTRTSALVSCVKLNLSNLCENVRIEGHLINCDQTDENQKQTIVFRFVFRIVSSKIVAF